MIVYLYPHPEYLTDYNIIRTGVIMKLLMPLFHESTFAVIVPLQLNDNLCSIIKSKDPPKENLGGRARLRKLPE